MLTKTHRSWPAPVGFLLRAYHLSSHNRSTGPSCPRDRKQPATHRPEAISQFSAAKPMALDLSVRPTPITSIP